MPHPSSYKYADRTFPPKVSGRDASSKSLILAQWNRTLINRTVHNVLQPATGHCGRCTQPGLGLVSDGRYEQ